MVNTPANMNKMNTPPPQIIEHNSTNINKANNHLSLSHLTQKNMTSDGNPGHDLWQV
jgi:hypothetical protein